MMKIATLSGKVVLVGDSLPSEWNGEKLSVYDLTSEQEAQYAALRKDREEAHFDGETFSAIGSIRE